MILKWKVFYFILCNFKYLKITRISLCILIKNNLGLFTLKKKNEGS
jgi:hypothetical protein